MDLMYLPDTIGFQPRYYGYGHDDQVWVNINQVTSEKPRKEKSRCGSSEKNCSLCRNKQKRVLSNYIRKARRDSDRDMCIEEEDEEDDQVQMENSQSNGEGNNK